MAKAAKGAQGETVKTVKESGKVDAQGEFPCPWEDGYVGATAQALRGHMVGSRHLKSNGAVPPSSQPTAPRSAEAVLNEKFDVLSIPSNDDGIKDLQRELLERRLQHRLMEAEAKIAEISTKMQPKEEDPYEREALKTQRLLNQKIQLSMVNEKTGASDSTPSWVSMVLQSQQQLISTMMQQNGKSNGDGADVNAVLAGANLATTIQKNALEGKASENLYSVQKAELELKGRVMEKREDREAAAAMSKDAHERLMGEKVLDTVNHGVGTLEKILLSPIQPGSIAEGVKGRYLQGQAGQAGQAVPPPPPSAGQVRQMLGQIDAHEAQVAEQRAVLEAALAEAEGREGTGPVGSSPPEPAPPVFVTGTVHSAGRRDRDRDPEVR
jgi:hypothetical protein